MKKLTPKTLIGLSTVTFLFFLLMGTVYLNDQVTFNTVNAEWELKDEYQIGVTQPAIYDEQTFINQDFIDFTILYNSYIGGDGNIYPLNNYVTIYFDTIPGATYEIENPNGDRFTISETNNFDFYNTVGDRLGFFESSPFIYVANKTTGMAFVNTSEPIPSGVSVYEDVNIIQTIIIQPTQSAITSYQVFENIRNNATTANPLGFMNAIMEIPAVNIGYMRSIIEFFDVSKYKDVLGLNDTPSELMDRTDTWWFNIYERILGVGQ